MTIKQKDGSTMPANTGKPPKDQRMRKLEPQTVHTTKDYADYLRQRYSAVRKPKQEASHDRGR